MFVPVNVVPPPEDLPAPTPAPAPAPAPTAPPAAPEPAPPPSTAPSGGFPWIASALTLGACLLLFRWLDE